MEMIGIVLMLQHQQQIHRSLEIHVRAEAFASARVVVSTSGGVYEPSALQERTKSAMTAGAVTSKPTTSNMPQSFGAARVKPLEVMPTTTARLRVPGVRHLQT